MSIDVMLSQQEISFREEFRAFLEGLDLSFILRMDREDEKEFPKEFVRLLGQNNYLGIPLSKDVGGRGLNTVCAILGEEELGALAFPGSSLEYHRSVPSNLGRHWLYRLLSH
jgi:alkylation response protein AidB-like acyl-CoA dehydrogenase